MKHSFPEIPTSLEREREEQRRWRPLAGGEPPPIFAQLLENEFRPPDFHRQRQSEKLLDLFSFAVGQVPFYRERFVQAGLKPADVSSPDEIVRLPVLSKLDLLDHFEAMQAARLPKGERRAGVTKSSGTTGRPVTVSQTSSTLQVFGLLWCRQARWFRFDPDGLFARIRTADGLRPRGDGTHLKDGCTQVYNRWTYAGRFFSTGPEIGCNIGNSREWQIRWLREHEPQYLLSFPGLLEEIALASEGRQPAESLQGLLAVASLLTPSMEQLITRVFEAPVFENYGLNEAGIVATRCSGGRYHVHPEANLVEIVDEDGQPVAPGETGRLLVTSLRNYRMPLFRYDTGDLAVAASGRCPCGRTLPSIADIVGRYRRFGLLPEGTRERYNAIAQTVEGLPAELLLNLRQFQVHQFTDNRFELRLRAQGELPEAFFTRVRDAWVGVAGESAREALEIRFVDEIEGSPGGKLLEFTSDLYSEADGDETLAGRTHKSP